MTGWRNSTGAGEVHEIIVSPSFVFSQALIYSGIGKILVAPGVMDLNRSSLCFVDIQLHQLNRLNDLDSNGSFETWDTRFSVSIPPRNIAADPSTFIARSCNPIFGFSVLGTGEVLIDTAVGRSRQGLPRIRIAWDASALDFVLEEVPFVLPRCFAIAGALIPGQERIRVTGPAAATFKIESTRNGVTTVLANNLTMPSDGDTIVDLSTAVPSTGEVAARLTTGTGVKESAPRTPDAQYGAVLFEDDSFWHQNQTVRVLHSNLPSTARMWCRWENNTEEVIVRRHTKKMIEVTMPGFGSQLAAPPFAEVEAAFFWMTAADGTTVLTPTIFHTLWHD